MRVLIVDPFKDSAYSLKLCLEMLGNDVREAENEDTAQELDFVPDIVIIDIVLKNAFKLGETLEQRCHATVIVLTGYYTPEIAQDALRRGWIFLMKPTQPEDLNRLMRKIRKVA